VSTPASTAEAKAEAKAAATADGASERPTLRVRDLAVSFATDGGVLHAVDGASFDVPAGGAVALVGESGSGKTATAHALMRILPESATILRGSVELEGRSLFDLTERDMRAVRGDRMAIVFQEPMSALNPVYTAGAQIAEAVRLHRDVSRAEAKQRAIAALRAVGMPGPEDREADFPHQLSGGMRQRVLLAMALVNEPALLIADEPTTALDATVEARSWSASRRSGRSGACPSCSSPTTSSWWRRSSTRSWSCSPDGPSSPARAIVCSTPRRTRTPARSSGAR